MFKIIRKLYFKFYHLIKLLGIFILMFGLKNNVYAEEYNTCFDAYKIGTVSFDCSPGTTWCPLSPYFPFQGNNIPYYVRFFSSNTLNSSNFLPHADSYDSSYNWLSRLTYSVTFDDSSQILTITPYRPPSNTSFISISYKGSDISNLANSIVIASTNLEDITSCSSSPPVPDDNVFSEFLTIYTDRISYLANGFTENPYLLAMVGIIFAWIVLELFLHIFHLKGGYKK